MNDGTLGTGLKVHCIYIGSNNDHWSGCYMSQCNLAVIWATYHHSALCHKLLMSETAIPLLQVTYGGSPDYRVIFLILAR